MLSSTTATATPPPHLLFRSSSSSSNSNPSFLPARPTLAFPHRPRLSPARPPLLSPIASSSSPPPPPPDTESKQGGLEEHEEEESTSESESGDGIEIEVVRVGRNGRQIRARVGIAAGLDAVWAVLTDYEGLSEFIPSLAVSQLLEKKDDFAKLYQVGRQDLALGLQFDARGVLECYERDLRILPSGRTRDIDFRMVEGDFKTFEGTWSISQNGDMCQGEFLGEQESESILSYVVEVEPKLWLPVRLLEGRLCREVRLNLSCVRQEAERVENLGQSALSS